MSEQKQPLMGSDVRELIWQALIAVAQTEEKLLPGTYETLFGFSHLTPDQWQILADWLTAANPKLPFRAPPEQEIKELMAAARARLMAFLENGKKNES